MARSAAVLVVAASRANTREPFSSEIFRGPAKWPRMRRLPREATSTPWDFRHMRLVAAAILTMNNLTTVRISHFSEALVLGDYLPLSISVGTHLWKITPSHTLSCLVTRVRGFASPLDKLGCCLSAETHARMVLALEAREGPITQDQAGRPVAVSGHLFEGIMATFHLSCIAGEVAEFDRKRCHDCSE